MKTVEERVKLIIAEYCNQTPEEISCDSSFEDLGVDSLDDIEIVMALEEEFGIEIPDAEAEAINSVQVAIDYIEKMVH
jgi:acyl carrier protein